jgi:hypothetical protein
MAQICANQYDTSMQHPDLILAWHPWFCEIVRMGFAARRYG